MGVYNYYEGNVNEVVSPTNDLKRISAAIDYELKYINSMFTVMRMSMGKLKRNVYVPQLHIKPLNTHELNNLNRVYFNVMNSLVRLNKLRDELNRLAM